MRRTEPRIPRRRWQEMTVDEVRRLDAARVVAVLPVAAVEQHGPHLPLGTDALINQGTLDRALALLPADAPVTVLPMMSVGKSNEHLAFPGTLTHTTETLYKAWMEIADGLAAAGVRRLVIYNSHGGQSSLGDIVIRDLRVRHGMIAVMVDCFRMADAADLFGADELRNGIHAGAAETSWLLALRPELVRMDLAPRATPASAEVAKRHARLRVVGSAVRMGWQAQDLHESGVAGDATAADAAKGRALLERTAQMTAELLVEVASLPATTLRPGPPR
ncbi:MAG: creatininase family protein [SAR202 cluster bacterium]|nr:creatininase family protein [SAR202 cluster bacterium]